MGIFLLVHKEQFVCHFWFVCANKGMDKSPIDLVPLFG
jgi:hypothetical protein